MPPAHLRTAQSRAAQPPTIAAEQHSPELADVRVTNPRTSLPWPMWNDSDNVLLYLERVYGLKRSKQTLAHHRSKGIGIKWRWFGQVPVTTLAEVDRYVAEEALKDRSPLAWRAPPKKAGQSA